MNTNFANHRVPNRAAIGLLTLSLLAALDPGMARGDEKTNAASVITVVTNVQVDFAAKLVAEGKVTVLDVRTPAEFAEGHIAGATNINFMAKDFAIRVGQLDRDRVYLLHCATGGRSKRCLPQLRQLGFRQIYHLDGGFSAWEEAGKPVVKK
jgi:phage shock protein E